MRQTGKRQRYLVFAAMLFLLGGCQKREAYKNIDFAMGTTITQNFYSKEEKKLSEKVIERLKELETKELSWRVEGSEVEQINRAAGKKEGHEVSNLFIDWIEQCTTLSELTDGKFDITVGSVARLWDIGGENPKIPGKKELKEKQNLVGYEKIHMNENKVSLEKSRMQLDLGAVGKGIGCDEIRKIAEQQEGFIGGIFSVGGSNLVIGQKPTKEPWKIAVQDPDGENGEPALALEVTEDCNISTSGDYEKYFEEDGERYHHILDGKTGYPAKSGLRSVTVITDTGLMADGLSTSCFLVGLEEGKQLLEQCDAEGIFITEEKKVYATEKIRSQVSILNQAYVWGD